MTHYDVSAGVFAAAVLAALLWLPAGAQVPPPGVVPPVTGIACLPDTPNIGGCVNKVYMPLLGVTVADEAGRNVDMVPVMEVTE